MCIYWKKAHKKRISLLNLLINSISARSAPQKLSMKDEYIFRFSNVLINSLLYSSANSFCFAFYSFLPYHKYNTSN